MCLYSITIQKLILGKSFIAFILNVSNLLDGA